MGYDMRIGCLVGERRKMGSDLNTLNPQQSKKYHLNTSLKQKLVTDVSNELSAI